MVCPYCSHAKTEVYNSRPTKKMNALWRRRRCLACKKEFTTRELVDVSGIIYVQESDTKVAPFSKAILLLSLAHVCDHRHDDAAYWLAETIEQELLHTYTTLNTPLTKALIKDACVETLKRFDTQALIKYLSYYSDSFDTKVLKKQLRKKK